MSTRRTKLQAAPPKQLNPKVPKDPIRERLNHDSHGVDVWRFGSGGVIKALKQDLRFILDEHDALVEELLKTRQARDALQADIEKLRDSEKKNARLAGAYVRDRAHKWVPSSGIHSALLEVAQELSEGNHVEAYRHGELDDLVAPKEKKS